MGELQCVVDGISLVIRHFKKDELEQAQALTDLEDWTITKEEYETIFISQPTALVGAFTENGTLICFLIAMKAKDALAYIGDFVCRADHRGRGIGKNLLSHVLGMLEGRCVILDSLPGRGTFYSRLGFKPVGLSMFAMEVLIDTTKDKQKLMFDHEHNVHVITAANAEAVLQYDKSICSIDRADYMQNWILADSSMSYGAFDKDGCCLGYTCFRFNSRVKQYRPQPLYADSIDVAKCLISAYMNDNKMDHAYRIAVKGLLLNKDQMVKLWEEFGNVEITTYRSDRMMTLVKEFDFSAQKVYAVVNQNCTLL